MEFRGDVSLRQHDTICFALLQCHANSTSGSVRVALLEFLAVLPETFPGCREDIPWRVPARTGVEQPLPAVNPIPPLHDPGRKRARL